jgi:ABC-2 type transport system permease protein
MANVLTLAWKDLVLLSRDRMAMFFLLVFPILMGVLFGLMYQGLGTPQPGGVGVAVVDEDHSPMSQALIENLREQQALKVTVTRLEAAQQQLRTGNVLGIVIVPEGFGKTAGIFWADNPVPLRLGRDPSRMAEAAMLEGYLMEAAGKLMAERLQDTQVIRDLIDEQQAALQADTTTSPLTKLWVSQLFASLDQLVDNLDQVARLGPANGEVTEKQSGRNFQFIRLEPFDAFHRPTTSGPTARSGWDLSFPQSILWGVMASAAGFAMSLVREQTRGTLLRLQTSPLQPREIILAKA